MRLILPEGILATKEPAPFATPITIVPPATIFPDLRDLNLAVCTLLSLSVTSRDLYNSAIDVLYEVVLIDSDEIARHLHRTLVENPNLSHRARRTQHLILTALTPAGFHFLPSIIRLMDSLSIFSVQPIVLGSESGHDVLWNRDISVTLQETCGHSLRKLHLSYNSYVFLSTVDLGELLSHTPRLRTLVITEVALLHKLKLPLFEELSFLAAESGFETPSLPDENPPPFASLTHLYIEPVLWTHDRAGFLQRQGQLITSVTLDLVDRLTNTPIVMSKLHHLWRRLPRVVHVHLVLGWRQQLDLALPPTTTHLSIWWPDPPPALEDDDPEVAHWVEFFLVKLRSTVPGALPEGEWSTPSATLQVIRLANPAHAGWLRRCLKKSSEGRTCTAEYGKLRIEGPDGRPFPCFVLQET
jgi:hypothetical protein